MAYDGGIYAGIMADAEAAEHRVHRETAVAPRPTGIPLGRAQVNVRRALINVDRARGVLAQHPIDHPCIVRDADVLCGPTCRPFHDIIDPIVEYLGSDEIGSGPWSGRARV